jgi:hypothetical protein
MKIIASDFLKKINKSNKSYKCSSDKLVELVRKNWGKRIAGKGRKNLNEVVVVPVPRPKKEHFCCSWVNIKNAKKLTAKVRKRQSHEDSYIEVYAAGKKESVRFVDIVLYSKKTLAENKENSVGDADWEIVAVVVGPWKNPPMNPLTMARNYLRKVGGTYAPYTAKQFAESIYFWSQYVKKS